MRGFFASSSVQQSAPVTLLPKCGACGLYKHCETPKMKVHGNGRRGVLIVGEAPGEAEDEEGKPFVGKAGQYLRDALDEIAIDLDEDAWSTNSIICHPRGSKPPDDKQITYCRPNLATAIARLRPTVVLTLGRTALVSTLKPYWREVGQMQRWTGWQMPLSKHWVCPTYHPSFLLRMNSDLLGKMFVKDLDTAFKLRKAPDFDLLAQASIKKLYNDDEIVSAIDSFEDKEWVAFDYETNCLKPEYPGAKVFCAALSDGKTTISYPWTGKAVAHTGEFLRRSNVRKIASNLKFEERWTRKLFGHGVRRWGWDTMLGAHVCDSREGITSLKFQMLVKLGVPSYNTTIEPYLGSSAKDRMNSIHEIALPELLTYNGFDALWEIKLAQVQRKEMGYED